MNTSDLVEAIRAAYDFTEERRREWGSIASLNIGYVDPAVPGARWEPESMGIRDALARLIGQGAFAQIPSGRPPRILEAGAGLGANLDTAAVAFAMPGAQVFAADLVESMTRTGVQRGGAHHLGFVGDTAALPVARASIDLALAIETLHYCPDLVAATLELRRVTRPSGWVGIAGIALGESAAVFAEYLGAPDGLGLAEVSACELTAGILLAAKQRRAWLNTVDPDRIAPGLVDAVASFDDTNRAVFASMERNLITYWAWAGRVASQQVTVAPRWRDVLAVPERRTRRQARNLAARSLSSRPQPGGTVHDHFDRDRINTGRVGRVALRALRDEIDQGWDATDIATIHRCIDALHRAGGIVRTPRLGVVVGDYKLALHALRNPTALVEHSGAVEAFLGTTPTFDFSRSLTGSNPPEHGRRRLAIAPALRHQPPDADDIEWLADKLRRAQGHEIEVVDAILRPFALAHLARVLDTSADTVERPALRLLSAYESPELFAGSALTPDVEQLREAAERSLASAQPTGTTAPTVLRAALRAGQITSQEALDLWCDLAVAGFHTTTLLLGWTLRAVLDGVLPLATATSEAVPPWWISECLRSASPTRITGRVASEPLELGSVRVRAGERITIWLEAANRDPAVYPDPDALQPDRSAAPLSFGGGIHHCVGAPLAERELHELLRACVIASPRGTVVSAQRPRSPVIGGLGELVVRFDAR